MNKTVTIITAGPICCQLCDFKATNWDGFREHINAHDQPQFTIPEDAQIITEEADHDEPVATQR